MKEYLYCIDSDGCAMDTMTIKHVKCFGPQFITVFGLAKYQNELIKRWNDINLYEKTRGINRFAGLHMILNEIDSDYMKINGLDEYNVWYNSTDAFSEAALEDYISAHNRAEYNLSCLFKALKWSKETNKCINALTEEEKKAFPGVKETIELLHDFADVAVVSSANRAAVEEEWERCGLLEHVDYVCAQDIGDKKSCIANILSKGYDRKKTVMIGDAVGDEEAASCNGVGYFQIVPGRETESWEQLKHIAEELKEVNERLLNSMSK